jgi:hypothetical protein
MREHTIEPEFGSVERASDFERYPDARLEWVGLCVYCNQPIESNDPEYQWFHVGE